MSRCKTKEEFIKDSINIHGSKLDYSKVVYVNSYTKVDIICDEHGLFSQTPKNHLNKKQGCPSCSGNKRKTTKIFIEDSNKIHCYRYDYSKSIYINNHTKVDIICDEHGLFSQTPDSHLRGSGCSSCSGNKRKTTKIFIEDSNKIHCYRYDYSKSIYINNNTYVDIGCEIHGVFKQLPTNHLSGKGCIKCSGVYQKNTEEFVINSNITHNNLYDYSKTVYISAKLKVLITCEKHGDFKQTPNSHLCGSGCPSCSLSRGELEIIRFFIKNDIKYEKQKKFNGCVNKRLLSFDFYLTEYNLCLEYDGIQHFKIVEHFGGYDKFKLQIKLDSIKNNYCLKNNINLFRISYKNYDNINVILSLYFKVNEI